MEQNIQNIIEPIKQKIHESNTKELLILISELHPADIAELFDELDLDEQSYILKQLDNEISADVLVELEDDDRKELLQQFTAKEIAEEVINEIDTDDAVDIISELSDDKKDRVIAELLDEEHAKDIVDLLRYDEDTAGGIMGKELIKVKQDWNVITAIKEMRKQAEELDEVFSIYVVDEEDKLLGLLSLKKLLTTSAVTKVEQVYNPKVRYVKAYQNSEEVANFIQKYDLIEAPVIDEMGKLVGRITVDDVIDVIREEAERDYQLASGISKDVDYQDSILQLTRARLPWLLIGVIGSIFGSIILKSNEQEMSAIPMLILFIPLIGATAGNVGVQASAIVVQGLANGSLNISLFKNLKKELLLSVIIGIALSLLIFVYNMVFNQDMISFVKASFAVSTALFCVVLFSASVGTVVPLVLHKKGIDPAIATGPFITTTNDLLGMTIYFLVAKLILGF